MGHVVEAAGRVIHTWFAGEGRPAVLLHGFSDDGSCWVGTAPVFTARGRQVIAPDARAHGRTPLLEGDDFTATARLGDAFALMSALDADRALIVGHSMGAVTAMQLAARHTHLTEAVILIDPPLADVDVDEQRKKANPFEAWVAEVAAMDADLLAERCRIDHPTWTDAEVEIWAASKKAVDQDLFRRRQSWHDGSWRATLGEIEVPVLLVAGEPHRGSLVDEAAGVWLAEHPDIEFVRIDEAGHSVHRDAAGDFASAVVEFLDRRLDGAPITAPSQAALPPASRAIRRS